MKTADHYAVCVELSSPHATVTRYYLDKDFLTDGQKAMERMGELAAKGLRVWVEPHYGPLKLLNHGKMNLVEKPENAP